MGRVIIVDKPNLIGPVLVKVKRENRAEPDPRHDAWPEISSPQSLALLVKEHQLEGALGEEKHAYVRVDLRIGAVDQQDRFRPVLAEVHRNCPKLADRWFELHLQDRTQVNRTVTLPSSAICGLPGSDQFH
jgi:hypothetical protein